jgi:hypothetical protein
VAADESWGPPRRPHDISSLPNCPARPPSTLSIFCSAADVVTVQQAMQRTTGKVLDTCFLLDPVKNLEYYAGSDGTAMVRRRPPVAVVPNLA